MEGLKRKWTKITEVAPGHGQSAFPPKEQSGVTGRAERCTDRSADQKTEGVTRDSEKKDAGGGGNAPSFSSTKLSP